MLNARGSTVKRRIWWRGSMAVAAVLLASGGAVSSVEAKTFPHLRQVASMRPADSLKIMPLPEGPRSGPAVEAPASRSEAAVSASADSLSTEFSGTSYDPSGRRDPFLPMIQLGQQTEQDATLPPLQRVGLTELSLIGVLWGNYGYTAMVQTPDGKGYSIRRGTRIGPNNGVVSSITERGIIVQERFTDVYGNKQEREYVKLLHPKEGTE
ncbi:putative Type IV pilus assembly protein PilP [Nitrospira defluvii]|jgi:type IV pilus assembly protein PilP|uniref:Putative Type IV pilus assembly protein PilP n=1 Tax=Nitrospira defluvii TaxID=330214 RepID=D8PCZ2_9BACT|nr:putative Type IV pilus assembly protein PilP [Nitrospira defluvii]